MTSVVSESQKNIMINEQEMIGITFKLELDCIKRGCAFFKNKYINQ